MKFALVLPSDSDMPTTIDPKDYSISVRFILESSCKISTMLLDKKRTDPIILQNKRGYAWPISFSFSHRITPNNEDFDYEILTEIQINSKSENGISKMIEIDEKVLDDMFGAMIDINEAKDDVILETCDGFELKANMKKLSEKSSVFKAMFTHAMTETTCRQVQIKDIDREILVELLRFVYWKKVKNLEEIAFKLFEAAHKYDIQELEKMCVKSIKNRLEEENVVEIVEFAELFNLADLFNSCCQIFER